MSWIVEDNILSKRTQSGRVEVAKKLQRRYLLDRDQAVFSDFCDAWRATHDDSQTALLACLLFGARGGFFRMSACRWLYPLLRRPGTALRTESFQRFVNTLGEEHPRVASWANSTKLSVSQHFLTAVRDFGLAKGKANKVSHRPSIGPIVAWYAARLAELQNLPPREALQSDWFVMLGLNLDESIHVLCDMTASGLGRFRAEGQVVELETFPLH